MTLTAQVGSGGSRVDRWHQVYLLLLQSDDFKQGSMAPQLSSPLCGWSRGVAWSLMQDSVCIGI